MTVKEVLAEMTAEMKANGKISYNRFNKKNFEKLLKAAANDVDLVASVVKVKKGQIDSIENIEVTKGFRKFCKKLVEKFGVDKTESEKILTKDFQFDSTVGLYEFFAEVMYLYLEAGNRFELLPKKDFKGSIAVKKVKETKTRTSAYSPKDRAYLGDFDITKSEHTVLTVKSPCPKYLINRVKVK